MKKAIELLVQLYVETGRCENVAEWKQKLDEFEKTKQVNATPEKTK